jgi:hypothetical protein
MTSTTKKIWRAWEPLPHTLDEFRSYLKGFLVNGKKVFAKVPYIAKALKCSVRTAFRYLGWLRDHGELENERRTPRHVVRQVIEKKPTGTSRGTCIEVESEVRTSVCIRNTAPAALPPAARFSETPSDAEANAEPFLADEDDPWKARQVLKSIPTPIVIIRHVGDRIKKFARQAVLKRQTASMEAFARDPEQFKEWDQKIFNYRDQRTGLVWTGKETV